MKDHAGHVLPDFLGIGAMRCGTTLLHHLLASHPEIYVPQRRKEIQFFDKHYGKGLEWYTSFFPDEARASHYKAIGEVTPVYIFRPDVPQLVKQHLPHAKFIVMLRNPVNRLYSHFRFNLAQSAGDIDFRDFVSGESPAVRRGFYAEQLTRWLREFPRERFLVFVFEEFIADPDAAVDQLATFLGVEADKFDKRLFQRKAAASLTPRMPQLYRAGIGVRNFLRNRDLDRVYAVLRLGRALLARPSRSRKPRELSPAERNELYGIYVEDISRLEALLDRNLDIWRPDSLGTMTRPGSASSTSRS